MESESVAKPGASAKPRFFSYGLLFGVVIATIAFWWMENRNQPTDSPTVLNIGDGSGMMGREILAAAAVLSGERGMAITFSHDGKSGSIYAMRQFPDYGIEIDVMSIRVTPWKFEINDEEVSLSLLRERLQTYGRAAKLTDSRPILAISCSDGVDGTRLVEVFSILADAEITEVRIADRFEIVELRPTPPPEPQVKPLAHPIELK
ncbi:MAG: hypothetical protein JNJ70_01510 [Verrucomicrobiales bacterium]|nr:hypothetical protein [Verrucomicrobiales bacterium]